MTRQSRIYEDPVDSSLRNIGVIPVYDPPLEEMQRRRKRSGRFRQDGGGDEDDGNRLPTDIGLESLTISERVFGAVVGDLSVADPDLPNDFHALYVDDSRFEIIDAVLKLKDSVQLLFADAAVVRVRITATDSKGKSFSENFDLQVLGTTNAAPTDIELSNLSFNEQSPGVPVGVVTVIDPDPADVHTFVISDVRFEIVDLVLKLKTGQQVVFSAEPVVNLTIQAIDQGLLSVTVPFTLTVNEQIIPDPNHAPTDVLLSATVIDDMVYGDIVGTVSAVDEDLPNDTMTFTVDDQRFVIVGDVLRLKPPYRVSFASEPTVPIVLTVRDSAGATVDRLINLTVSNSSEAPDLGNAIFVAPSSVGSGSGSSFANATGWASINSVIASAASSGKQVLLASHLGNYTAATRTITAGGAPGTRVKVWGCNAAGLADDAVIVGTRANPWSAGLSHGPEVFRLLGGANRLHFRNITFRDCGNGCFRVGASIADLVIETCTGLNVRRFIENLVSGVETSATITGLIVRNCAVIGYSRAFARIQYNSSDMLFEDCLADSQRQDGDPFATGFAISGTSHDFTFRRVTSRNHFQVVAETAYWNADGFSTEVATFDWLFEDCRATGNTDGGFDLKGNGTIRRCTAADNKRNIRLWDIAVMEDCRILDPNIRGGTGEQSQLWVDEFSNATVTGSAFCDNKPNTSVFTYNAGTSLLTVTDSSVQKHQSALLTNNPGGAVENNTVSAAPTFSVIPVVTGVPVANQILSSSDGTCAGAVSRLYQWLRSGEYIDDAVAATYLLVDADVGHTMSCRVFGIDVDGFIGEATSLETEIVTASAISNTVLPAITGPPLVNGTLTVTPGTWEGVPAPTLTYQWEADGVAISGATATTFTLTTAQLGAVVTVTENGTNDGGQTSITVESAATAAVGAVGSVSTFWIRPSAQGAATGFNTANAASISAIDSLISAGGPGAIINIVSDDGDYPITTKRTIRHGGAPGNHVVIRGRTLANGTGQAQLVGTRFEWTRLGKGTLTNPFTTTDGSPIVTVAHVAHGLAVNKHINFADATAVGGITIDGHYQVTQVVGPDSFTITHHANASSGASGGGTVAYDYEIVTDVRGQAVGSIVFELATGANYLTFQRLHFERCGDGCIKILNNINNLSVDLCTFFNVKRFIEQSLSPVSYSVLRVTNCSGEGISECAIRMRGQSNDIEVTDCEFDAGRQSGDNFCMCLQMTDQAFNITFTRVIARDADGTFDGSGYWNGDGFTAEGNDDITFIDCEAYGCSDAGFDLKATNVIMTNCTAGNNSRNFRLWGQSVVTDPISLPLTLRGGSGSKRHISSYGWFTNHPVVIRPVIVSPVASTQFTQEGDAQLWVRDPDISASVGGTNGTSGTLIFYDGADVTPATITSSDDHESFDGALWTIPLTANETVMWRITGGADASKFIREYQRLSFTTTHTSAAPLDANADNIYEVQITAKDKGDNDTVQNITVEVKPPAARAVTFDGTNDWISRSASIGPQTNSPYFAAAGRVKFNGGDGTAMQFYSMSGPVAQLQRTALNKLSFNVSDGISQTNRLDVISASDFVVANGWIDFIVYAQTNFAAGLKIGKIWKRVSGGPWFDDTGVIIDDDASFAISYANRNSFGVFASFGGLNKVNADVSDFLIGLSQGPDPALQATRDRWSLDDGTWVYPGVACATFFGSTPRFAFSGKANVYGNNQGGGGAVILNGTLVDATPPP